MEDFAMSRGYIYNLVDDTIEYANFINDDTFFIEFIAGYAFPWTGKSDLKAQRVNA